MSKGVADSFDTSPLGDSEGVGIAIGTVAGIKSRENPPRSGDDIWEGCITSPGEWGMQGADGGKVSDGLLGVAGEASYAAEESGNSSRNYGKDRSLHRVVRMAIPMDSWWIYGEITKGASSTHNGKHSLA
jgi:hypothetical protein